MCVCLYVCDEDDEDDDVDEKVRVVKNKKTFDNKETKALYNSTSSSRRVASSSSTVIADTYVKITQ